MLGRRRAGEVRSEEEAREIEKEERNTRERTGGNTQMAWTF